MKITYSEPADVLTLEDEEYDGYNRSIEIEEMTADLADDNTCLGLQIYNAQKQLSLTPEELKQIEKADIDVQTDPGLRITATLYLDGETYTATAGSSQGLRKEDARR